MSVGVVGAGAWGTALAKLLAEKGDDVTLWCRESEVRDSIRDRGVNETFLPGATLPSSLTPTTELEAAVAEHELVVLAVPSKFLRSVVAELARDLPEKALLVSATKGIEEGTLLRMSEVISETVSTPHRLVAISGPTFAKEVAAGQPTALVAASPDEAAAKEAQERLSTRTFRVYTNDDIVGVELGGAVKNVIALAVGVAHGLGLGFNPKAALLTRGLAEMARLSMALGGNRQTLSGLAGMGDLVLTATGELSRNRTLGVALGEGRKLEEMLSSMPQVAEGVPTTHAATALARRHGVDVPITFQMERLLMGDATAEEAMEELLARPLRAE